MHPFERELLRQVHRCRLPALGGPVVVGLSGGPDSSALLAGLAALKLPLVAAHLDHGLRPDSDHDRAVAAALAEALGVPFVHESVSVGPGPRGSLEAGARSARYAFLTRVAQANQAAAVAVGHNRDDQVETILFRLLRGTGLAGLSGMRPVRRLAPGVPLVRPLLTQSRSQVEGYVAARHLKPVSDPSNSDHRFLRNRLRHDLLPRLRQENPQVDRALLRLARQARRAYRNLDTQARALLLQATRAAGWSEADLRAADPAVRAQALSRALRVLSPEESGARHVHALEQILKAGAGAVTLPGGVRVGIESDLLCALASEARDAEDAAPEAAPLPLGVPGEVLDVASGLLFAARRLERPRSLTCDPQERVLIDAARVAGRRIAIRRRRAGDRFWPLGAPGHRSLKRFFIDQRVPREMRSHVPVVTVDDQPLWIVGHRLDEQFKVTPSTAEVLELRASKVVSGLEELS